MAIHAACRHAPQNSIWQLPHLVSGVYACSVKVHIVSDKNYHEAHLEAQMRISRAKRDPMNHHWLFLTCYRQKYHKETATLGM